jgi:sulfur carrier protein
LIRLSINGEEKDILPETTLQQLLEQLGYSIQSVAVAIDGLFIPRSRYPETRLVAECKLDIVSPMQGG